MAGRGGGGSKSSSLYAVLGVASDCSDADLRNTYRKLAMKWHPDKCAGSSVGSTNVGKARFRKIQGAYAGRYSDASYVFSGDYYQEAGAFFNRIDNTLLAIQERQTQHGRLLEQQQKWNQDHAAAGQDIRGDTTTMNDNITTMMRF
ncbi:uncharacterized protein LOC110433673 [Sorghum bicolor]|uniref:uncharacterized protein LOC110433673 n=1 Tax=Sorghum bicolor TaxID=4558 RepID=UPI000B426AED|nr:uncharacterized protein LOC110433673 [Sorghum bicolor]|eukprot:XP_021311857.1 uncharacterized protein LOC110433673 [Sorghum bicolor]